MLKPILFYDIPSTLKRQAWSPNTWKTRYALNFKGIPYKTVWIAFPDIVDLYSKIGAEPTIRRDGSPNYCSLPVIQDPNTNTVVSDSFRIAEYLEKTYPETPKLFPAGSIGVQAVVCNAIYKEIMQGLPLAILQMVHSILQPRCQEYFRRTREKTFGKPIEAFSKNEEEQWGKMKNAFSTIAGWYDKNGGSFIQGDALTYGDLNVAALFGWYGYLTGKDSEKWREMLTWDNGKWAKLVEMLEPYEESDENKSTHL